MATSTIIFRISGSEIALESAPGAVTAGSISEPQCRFRFSEQWDDYGAKLAFFGTDRDRLVPMALAPVAEEARSYYCYIPRAVLVGLQRGGELFICCSGSGSDSEAVLRTKLYTLRVADSGEAAIYLTESEAESMLGSVAAAMELQRNENALALELQRTENSATVASIRAENSAAIARLESGSIASAAINASHELVLTMKDGTAVNLGNVRGSDGTGIQSARVDGSGKLLITLSTGQVLDLGNVRGEPGDGIKSAEITDGTLWITTLYGSHYSAGYVKGEKGEKGDKGDTGAAGAQGVPGVPGTDGVSITGVTASLDAQNRRVFTFTFSDGSTRAVIVPGEVITVTDEDGEHPQSITVQAAVQSLGDAGVALDERSTTNSRRITALESGKADMYEVELRIDGDDNVYMSQEAIDNLYRLKPAALKAQTISEEEGTTIMIQTFSLVSAAIVPTAEYEGMLTYQQYNEPSDIDNNYVRIKIPKNAENPIIVEEVVYQEKIDSSNRLSADAVDDTNTVHKFISTVPASFYELRTVDDVLQNVQPGVYYAPNERYFGLEGEGQFYVPNHAIIIVGDGLTSICDIISFSDGTDVYSSMTDFDIRELLADKQDTLNWDNAPTAASDNPVTSAGIKTYVDTAVGNIETALQGLISGGGVA